MERLLEQLEPRSLRLLMLGLILVLGASLLSYGILPQLKELRKQRQSLALLEDLQRSQRDLEAEKSLLLEELDTLRKRLRGDLPDMPLKQLEAYMMGRLQMVSWNNHMQLLSVRPGMNQSVQRFDEISFDVEISGTYFDLFRWLWSLGGELGFVVVKHFEISPTSHEAEVPELLAKLTIVFYQASAS